MGKPDQTPFVSVVTPVFNGERYIAECIESVLNQSHQNFEYIIVNNCSRDNTLQIAEKYRSQDKRLQVHTNKVFLNPIDNWNHALEQIAECSSYCKIVHADDVLFPECIEKMLDIAERDAKIGIVGSYALRGSKVVCDGIPYHRAVVPGKEVLISSLKREYYLFGSPTSLLLRSDVIRNRSPFYNPNFIHADVEVCYEILKDYDFGFAHQVLTYTRLHDQSQTEKLAMRYNTGLIDNLRILKKYGPIYLKEKEYKNLIKRRTYHFYRVLASHFFRSRDKDLLEKAKKYFIEGNLKFSKVRLYGALLIEAIDRMINPKKVIGRTFHLHN